MKPISFASILESHAFSDFKLKVNDKIYLLHRAILSQRSQYFQELFKNDPTLLHKEVELSDDLVIYFKCLLSYLYSSPQFYVQPNSFCCLTQLAVIFKVPTLLGTLYRWIDSNLDYYNVLSFYQQLLPFKEKLEEFFKMFTNTIIEYFENLDFDAIATTLPFNDFANILSDERLSNCVSSYGKSLSIAKYLTKNHFLSYDQKSYLFKIYIETDWLVNFSDMCENVNEDQLPELIEFAARHFSKMTIEELNDLNDKTIDQLLASQNLDARSEKHINEKINLLLSSSSTNKRRSQILWNRTGDPNNPRSFYNRKITPKNLRCLVLGSMMFENLSDIKHTLVDSGLDKKNVVLYNADMLTPSLEFLFLFDVIFVFTHYQFQSRVLISERLTKYIKIRGGGVVYAYGFMRKDEWGCGEKPLIDLLPFERGKRHNDHVHTVLKIITNTQCDLVKDINQIKISEFSPRADVKLRADAHLIASYEDNIPFVAYSDIHNSDAKIVGLNYYPITSRIHRFGWSPALPIVQLLAKAVKFSVGIES
ncbi:BTB/POZ domain containing protein [Tritrichomonas foetus]|uniref:BTB/POZ domain containing protein n=1 Tax=Tritrichomonas foetus TaxID=1144522 RepID=A0A1J4KA65_9EUKA|nr:BTB/POZ domain containing protein [Tritrichomonas foetus]|eukprot:OHT08329.1 BTB/POZ domain containing protein [Tritrichomonas foetus]